MSSKTTGWRNARPGAVFLLAFIVFVVTASIGGANPQSHSIIHNLAILWAWISAFVAAVAGIVALFRL